MRKENFGKNKTANLNNAIVKYKTSHIKQAEY